MNNKTKIKKKKKKEVVSFSWSRSLDVEARYEAPPTASRKNLFFFFLSHQIDRCSFMVNDQALGHCSPGLGFKFKIKS
jgi:hypothetical protein